MFAGRTDRFDGDRLDHERLVHGEGVARAVRRLEGVLHGGGGVQRDGQARVRTGVTQQDAGAGADRGFGDVVGTQFGAGPVGQLVAQGPDMVHGPFVKFRLHGLFAHRGRIGQSDAVRGEHPGERRHDHRVDAERVGHRARVLAAGPAEGREGVAGDVVPPLHRDLLHGVRHVEDGDLEESCGDLLGGALCAGLLANPRGELGEALAHDVGVQRPVAGRTEDRREVGALDPAEHHIGVGDGERSAAPVAGRSGHGARRVGAHPVAAAVEMQHGTSARGHGVDVHHGRTHPDPGDLSAELTLELARVVRDIGGCAAHVEADDLAEPGLFRGACHPDDAAGRAGEHCVLAAEVGGFAQPAVGLHEHQPDALEFGRDLVDVPAQDRREIGVDDGGVPARHQLDQRADLVRTADLGEAEFLAAAAMRRSWSGWR